MKSEPTQAETIADLVARCDRPGQFDRFDRGVCRIPQRIEGSGAEGGSARQAEKGAASGE